MPNCSNEFPKSELLFSGNLILYYITIGLGIKLSILLLPIGVLGFWVACFLRGLSHRLCTSSKKQIKHETLNLSLLAIACLLALVCLAVYIEELMFLYKRYYVNGSKFRNFVILLAAYPVISVSSVITLLVPRSTILLDLVSSCYLSICIFTFVTMIIEYYGGDQQVLRALSRDKIVISVSPVCFCCCILKPITMTERVLFRIKLCSVQVAFIRPLLLFISSVLWTDGKLTLDINVSSAYTYLSIFSAISTMLSMYGLVVLYKASKKKLKQYLLRPKFVPLQICMLIVNMQNLLFSTLAQNDIPDCIGSRGPRVRASAMNHSLLIVEMLFLSLLARRGYRVVEKGSLNGAMIGATNGGPNTALLGAPNGVLNGAPNTTLLGIPNGAPNGVHNVGPNGHVCHHTRHNDDTCPITQCSDTEMESFRV